MVHALERGLAVLRCFGAERPSLSLSELASLLGWSRTAPYRLVYTLQRLGYLVQDPQTKRYRLGPGVLELGFEYLHGLPLPELAQPYLEQLCQQTGASAHLAILDGREIVYLARAAPRRISATNLHVGSRLPAHATSLGKVLLASQPAEALERLLSEGPLARCTERTIVDPEQLRQTLDAVRAQGFAVSDQEFEAGIRSVAAPIFDTRGAIAAAINVSAPAPLLSDEFVRSVAVPAVRRTAQQLSACLGHVAGRQ
ncbi:MAG: helix-turn-helix domain-containing protein [Chloroflexi bacterium]|nr:helix-turn-helix domain-containing protein [Chloroflexota bacterium]